MPVKEACLAIFVRLAMPRPEQPGYVPMMTAVFDAELISDILSLNLDDPINFGVVRNMLSLLLVMVNEKNEKLQT